MHARVAELNARMRAPERPLLAALASEFGLNRDAIARHAMHHLVETDMSTTPGEPAITAHHYEVQVVAMGPWKEWWRRRW
jgi:hypothetical protein